MKAQNQLWVAEAWRNMHSEGIWYKPGRATTVARMAALQRTTAPTPSGGKQVWKRGARKRDANQMGATIGRLAGKAPSDRPALKPYWGKPAVRKRVQEKKELVC